MSPERTPEFSPQENEEMGEVAIRLANAGEDVLNTAIGARNRLMATIITIYQANMYQPDALELLVTMEHDIDVMNEVIKRARAILKIQGTDIESEGKRLNLAVSFGRIGDSE